MDKQIKIQFVNLLKDVTFLISNDSFPIFKKKSENSPENILFVFPKKSRQTPAIDPSSKIILKDELIEEERNFACRRCSDRLSGIKTFLKNGRKPVLVLHYTGETKAGKKPFIKKSRHQTFRTEDAELVFDGLVKRIFHFSSKEFFFQEYPACNFSTETSSDALWQQRANHCNAQVEETILRKNIEGIIMLGSSAVVAFGMSEAKKKEGQITEMKFGESSVPVLVLRSPEAILQIRGKMHQFSEDSIERKNLALEEENLVKKILENLQNFRKSLRNLF